MNRSTELETLILQLHGQGSPGDIPVTFDSLLSRQDGVLVIGTDPTEWWQDHDEIIRAYQGTGNADNSGEKPHAKIKELNAFSEGSVGWVTGCKVYTLADGKDIPIRLTYILHHEDFGWKLVHIHYSIGIPNELIGQ